LSHKKPDSFLPVARDGRHAPARIGRHKNCRLTNKSPRAIGRGDSRNLWSEPSCYFKTIAVNG
jgi:hypothetical protein